MQPMTGPVSSRPGLLPKTGVAPPPPPPPLCNAGLRDPSGNCRASAPQPVKTTKSVKHSGPSIAEIGAEAAASITIPTNTPIIGPSPTQNKWGIIPVGYPIWLWTTDTQTAVSQTVTDQGLVVSVTATRQNVVFNMGDGNEITCTSFTARPDHNDPFQPSPTCGYIYLDTGQYTITATTTWQVIWQVSGESGSLTITDNTSARTPLPVGELHTVIVNPPS